jgi:hypothetical protein
MRIDFDYEHFYRIATKWKSCFAILPHRCIRTRRIIWLEWAYCGTIESLYESIFLREKRWMDKDTWLVEKLKGTI